MTLAKRLRDVLDTTDYIGWCRCPAEQGEHVRKWLEARDVYLSADSCRPPEHRWYIQRLRKPYGYVEYYRAGQWIEDYGQSGGWADYLTALVTAAEAVLDQDCERRKSNGR